MVDVGSRGSYALDGCATRSPQAPHVPTHGSSESGVDDAIASGEVAMLTTAVATVFRSIRAAATSQAVFSG